jgi:hypothetical protein
MDCLRASPRLDKLLLRYGLTRHPKNGVWGDGSQVLQHLGVIEDSVRIPSAFRRASWSS